jgi:hypothetical protein
VELAGDSPDPRLELTCDDDRLPRGMLGTGVWKTSTGSAMKVAVVLATVVSFLTLVALPVAAQSANPKPSWRCITGICLWESRQAIDYEYGIKASNIPPARSASPADKSGRAFWRCTDAVTEDGFTYYGGTQRPANRLLTVSTCDPIFRLPDGTVHGTRIPYRDRWNGYNQRRFEGGVIGWEKTVHTGRTKINVSLLVNQGRVDCVYLEVK